MALCTSGSMSLGGSTIGRSVNCELGCFGSYSINMNRADVRALAEKLTGAISMSDFYGKPSGPPLGSSLCGGIYMGNICAANSCYRLIVAPNATGCACCRWRSPSASVPGTGSYVDGYDNTYGHLDNATHPAGNFCATRTIGGFSDWYLPARTELETVYNNGATGGNESVIGTGEAFRNAARYWSSTSFSSFGRTWLFNSGPGIGSMTNLDSLRAFRREPV